MKLLPIFKPLNNFLLVYCETRKISHFSQKMPILCVTEWERTDCVRHLCSGQKSNETGLLVFGEKCLIEVASLQQTYDPRKRTVGFWREMSHRSDISTADK